MAESDRVAELKRKMQERAKQVKAETEQAESAAVEAAGLAPAQTPAAAPVAAPAPAASAAAPAVAVYETPVAVVEPPTPVAEPVAEAVAAPVAEPAPAARPVVAPAPVSTNGGASALSDTVYVEELSPEERAKRELGRREFLTYAFAGALALVAGATGFGIFEFMYPRFRAGEFGGEFFISIGEVPATDAAPVGKSDGKFWLVQSETEGPKALYMVCTHLGCLYKWEPSTFRFECPCHGSMFTKDGFYIRGPAARSLDRFETRIEGDILVVATGSKITGAPSSESPAREV